MQLTVFKYYLKDKDRNVLTSQNNKETINKKVNLAYNDAKRTMTGIEGYEKSKTLGKIQCGLKEYFDSPAYGKEIFDEKHQKLCTIWRDAFKEAGSSAPMGKRKSSSI